MKRRDLLTIGGAAAIAALTGCGGPDAASTAAPAVQTGRRYRWRLAMAVPKTFQIWAPAIERFAATVKTLTAGRMDIHVHGAGELVGGLEVFDAVKDGSIEMGHAAAYYWAGSIPAAPFFTSVPFGMTSAGMTAWLGAGGGQELWDDLYAPFNLKALPCGNTGIQAGGWFRRPLSSIADLKGLKIRMPGMGGKVLTRAGASAINMAGDELYPALERGVIDAVEWIGPFHDLQRGFHKIAKHYYTCGWQEPGSVLELLINRQAWELLPQDLRDAVTTAAAATDRQMYAQWLAADAEAYETLAADPNVVVEPFPLAIARALRPLAREVLDEVRGTSAQAARIHDAYFAFMQRFDRYQAVGERAYQQVLVDG